MFEVVGRATAAFFIAAMPACLLWFIYACHHPGVDRINPMIFALTDGAPFVASLMWIASKYEASLAKFARFIRARPLLYFALIAGLPFVIGIASRAFSARP